MSSLNFAVIHFPNQTFLLLIPFPNKNKPVSWAGRYVFVGFTSLIFATFSTDACRKIVLRVKCIVIACDVFFKLYFLLFVTKDTGVYMIDL
jgi:hypothetical protein